DCRVTVFAIGRSSFDANDPLRDLADPIGVGLDFDPSRIKIPYFDRRSEDAFFEPGVYRPLSLKDVLFQANPVDIPELSLSGSATTYAKEDASLMAVRPKLTDPVLAFKDSGAGAIGEFTTSLGDEWISREDG